MSILVDTTRKFCRGLRVVSYICGFAGMGMMLAARGMTEPGSTDWGQRAVFCLAIMFFGFIVCYILIFMANYMRKR